VTDSIDYVATDSAGLTSQAIDDVERGANDSDWQPAEAPSRWRRRRRRRRPDMAAAPVE